MVCASDTLEMPVLNADAGQADACGPYGRERIIGFPGAPRL